LALRGRLIGLDHGLARLGVAVSDRSGLLARELVVIERRSRREDFARLERIAAEQQAIGWVIGLPSTIDDKEGAYPQAAKVQTWVERLRAETPLPIVLWDEQLTTVDAHEMAQRLKRPSRAPVDDLAARVMLQSYLDALRDGLADAPPEWIDRPHEQTG
jgi:putative Holliday junction resolvase